MAGLSLTGLWFLFIILVLRVTRATTFPVTVNYQGHFLARGDTYDRSGGNLPINHFYFLCQLSLQYLARFEGWSQHLAQLLVNRRAWTINQRFNQRDVGATAAHTFL